MTDTQQLELFDQSSMADTITLTGSGAPPVLTISNGGILGTGLYGADTLSLDWDGDQLVKLQPNNRIQLHGDDADIEINGESVVSLLREIKDRLAILQVSHEMEAEWHELRQLRSQYEAKLAECQSKSSAWKALQQRG